MSFQAFITQQLAAISSALNAISTNAKKIDELPEQAVLEPASKIHVSKSGTSQSLSLQKIITYILQRFGQDSLTDDFFISNTYNELDGGNKLAYLTDTFRQLNIRTYLPADAFSTNHVAIIDKSTIFIHGQLRGTPNNTGNLFGLTLKKCKIADNILVVGEAQFAEFPFINRNASNVPYALHSCYADRGYVYLLTRTFTGSLSSQAVKINPYDLTDVIVKDIAAAGTSNNTVKYKNNIYAFMTRGLSLSADLIKFDENFNNLETVFNYANIDPKDRVSANYPFTIYNDEVYIATRWHEPAGANTIGVLVFDLFTGGLKRKVSGAVLPADPAGGSFPIPHWITVFNGKLIVATASGATLSASNKALCRFDAQTLVLEQAINLPYSITNDNSIREDGFIYLNSEFTTGTAAKLYRVKYNDFTTFSGIGTAGYYSLGSPVRNTFKETLKTKLSDFKNDLPSGGSTLQSVLNAGPSAVFPGNTARIMEGIGNDRQVEFTMSNQQSGSAFRYASFLMTRENFQVFLTKGNDTAQMFINATGDIGLTRSNVNFNATVILPSPLANTVSKFPNKALPGTYNIAVDEDVLHKAGDELITGNKTFSGDVELASIVIKDAGDATRRRITSVNGVLIVSAPL